MPNSKIKIVTYLILVVAAFYASGCAWRNAGERDDREYHIPVNAYMLQSEHGRLRAQINRQQLKEVMEKVNAIWQQANIQFYFSSVKFLQASNESNYLDLLNNSESNKEVLSSALKEVCIIPDYEVKKLNLCVAGELFDRTGGVYFNDDTPLAFWATVRHGNQYLKPGVLAHEFGHFLDLPHNGLSRKYLMRAKSSDVRHRFDIRRFTLTEDEIRHARKIAARYHNEKM